MKEPLALIADIHGNSWALDAVLADIDRRGVHEIVNLGDSVYGSLDPAGTAQRLMERSIPSIVGNQDRIVYDPSPEVRASADWIFVTEQLSSAQIEWMRSQQPRLRIDAILCCHGTPTSDETALLEDIKPHGVFLRDDAGITAMLAGVDASLIACAHSHVPRVVRLADGRTVVNPGSVGIPAYNDDLPYPHVMESGSPHARYALVAQSDAGWQVELIAVAYNWEAAASVAETNGRADRAAWIRSGRASLPAA
jgi:predicted phosphodiesterase